MEGFRRTRNGGKKKARKKRLGNKEGAKAAS